MTAIPWTASMPDDTPKPEAGRTPSGWWEALNSPLFILTITVLGGSGLLLWQQAPATGAQVSANAADIATIKGEVSALQRSQLALEADLRSNKEQMVQVREAVQEIKAFNAASMRELQNLNVQFAEIRGGLAKEKKVK